MHPYCQVHREPFACNSRLLLPNFRSCESLAARVSERIAGKISLRPRHLVRSPGYAHRRGFERKRLLSAIVVKAIDAA